MPVKKTGTSAKRTIRRKPAVTHEQIAERAYGKFVDRGRQPGHEMQDWLEAERELLAGKPAPKRAKIKIS